MIKISTEKDVLLNSIEQILELRKLDNKITLLKPSRVNFWLFLELLESFFIPVFLLLFGIWVSDLFNNSDVSGFISFITILVSLVTFIWNVYKSLKSYISFRRELSKIPNREDKLKQLEDEIRKLKAELHNNIIPRKLRKDKCLKRFVVYLKDGRANTLEECINLFEQEPTRYKTHKK